MMIEPSEDGSSVCGNWIELIGAAKGMRVGRIFST